MTIKMTMKKLSFLSRITLLLGFFFTLDKLLGFLRVIIIARCLQFILSTGRLQRRRHSANAFDCIDVR